MKLQVYRQSGQIVDDEAQQKFNSEWGPIFDRIMARVDAIHADKEHKLYMLPKHILSTRMCAYMERQLFKKYSTPIFETLPKSQRAWRNLCAKYGNPIMLAQRSDSNAMILVVMDTLS